MATDESLNRFEIGKSERLFLDGTELFRVSAYRLEHSAGGPAELTVTMTVNASQSES